jgi:PST family polysaccharide transporter
VSLRRATGRGTAWAFIGYLAHYGVTFVFTVITARLLSPEVFGIMGLAVVVIAVGTLLADSGTQAALVHRGDDDLDVAVNTALISVPLAGLGAAALGIAAAPLLAWFYGEPQVFAVAALLSGVLFVRSFGLVTDALLQRRFQFKFRRAVVDPLGALVGGATATALALAGAGVWSLVAMWYANTLTVVLGSWVLARYRPRLGLASFAMWRQLAHYGRNILGAHSVQLAFGYLDTLTVGRTMSPTFVGWYGAATRLAILPAQATTYVAGAALFPAFTRMRDDVARLRSAFLEAIRYIALLAFPLFAILAVIATPFVVVLFGEQWRPTGPVLSVMMLYVLPLSLFEPSMELFKAIGQPGRVFRLAILKFAAFAAYLAIIWGFDWITLERVAAGLGVSAAIGLAFTVPGVCRATGATPRQLWQAVRPAVGGALIAAAAMYAFSWSVLGDIEDHRTLFGADLGPVVPVLLMALVAAIGVAVFALAVEVLDRGSLRRLRTEGSAIFGRSGATAG